VRPPARLRPTDWSTNGKKWNSISFRAPACAHPSLGNCEAKIKPPQVIENIEACTGTLGADSHQRWWISATVLRSGAFLLKQFSHALIYAHGIHHSLLVTHWKTCCKKTEESGVIRLTNDAFSVHDRCSSKVHGTIAGQDENGFRATIRSEIERDRSGEQKTTVASGEASLLWWGRSNTLIRKVERPEGEWRRDAS
jgi:hypothetical protein